MLKLWRSSERSAAEVTAELGIHEEGNDVVPPGYTLMTTAQNSLMEKFHDQMQVILAREVAKKWILQGELLPKRVKDFCASYPADMIDAYVVSSVVNNAGMTCRSA